MLFRSHGGQLKVSVLNATGTVIRAFNIDSGHPEFSIDLTNEPEGLYYIRVASDNHSIQKKVAIY